MNDLNLFKLPGIVFPSKGSRTCGAARAAQGLNGSVTVNGARKTCLASAHLHDSALPWPCILATLVLQA